MTVSVCGIVITQNDNTHIVRFTFHDGFDTPVVKTLECVFNDLGEAEMFKEAILEYVRFSLPNTSDYMQSAITLAAHINAKVAGKGYSPIIL